METPASFGYRMPAEWEPHAATWLAWPHNRETWPGAFEPIPHVFAELARTIAEFEPVRVLAGAGTVMANARALVGDVPGVTLHDIPTNDCWIRDHGPTFLTGTPGAEPALVDWGYDAWGGKYPPFDLDNAVPKRIAELTNRRRFAPGMVLEGGAVDSNGQGALLVAERSVLDENRNPGLTRQAAERCLGHYLGARQILWLDGELAGDDTDGHVDQLARFVDPHTVVAASEEDPSDANHRSLRACFEQLEDAANAVSPSLTVLSLPMPRPKWFGDRRLPASYANFYVANGLVVVPQFDDPADAQALDILAGLFPGRQVRGLRALDLIWGLGAFHCATQQEPAQIGTCS